MQLQNNVTDSVELLQNVRDELSKFFIIKTVENLESFDDRLKKKKYFYYVVQFLKQKGGADERAHVFNILNSTISNSVACKYSYKDKKKKKRSSSILYKYRN